MNPFKPKSQAAPESQAALEDDSQPFVMPEGFSSRLMQRLDARQAKRRTRTGRLLIATAMLLGLSAGGLTALHQYEQRQQAQQARAQFVLAMQVTTKSLSAAEHALAKIDKTRPASNRSTQGEL